MNTEHHIRCFYGQEDRNQLQITPIQGDASTRRYYRVSGPKGSAIACCDPLLRETTTDDYPFLIVYDLLRRNDIPVPEVIAVNAGEGLLLIEDCGTLQLQYLVFPECGSLAADIYRDVIDTLAGIQAITGDSSQLPFRLSFDREKLMFEFDFFIEHALMGYFAPVSGGVDVGALRSEFKAIADILVQPERFVLNHRDFHSRNIMIRDGKPVIIDFQDARMGLPQYDAVSIIRDSYVALDQTLADELKTRHYQALMDRNGITMSHDEYLYLFDLMAFQRNIKAIGTFSYQTAVLKKTQYEHSIAPALRYLPDYISGRNELKKAGRLLQPVIEQRHER
ncbi:aminoglycoside phosphotransferase family protein [Chlorobium phaeobacteroides]|uniref:Aminoglycoside phosphotransferase n=1 Tax=Chlorobium phaeobacteroides (strain DSM 266 / SMG 266 / 2430) TaxID=290317 RepID=A1BCZ3_CHLPD|nr:phosphotransferase [Chlorobium phaeobacteroides]ABL64270.1 aminoglycoside phosphotransferase [Chlorobium phaeobacteroides DSM 266]